MDDQKLGKVIPFKGPRRVIKFVPPMDSHEYRVGDMVVCVEPFYRVYPNTALKFEEGTKYKIGSIVRGINPNNNKYQIDGDFFPMSRACIYTYFRGVGK